MIRPRVLGRGRMEVPMAVLDRLTALDAGFLSLESPVTPMHVGSLALFDGPPFFDGSGRFRLDELHRLVDERLDLVPRFRRRLRSAPPGLGRPVWVDDPDFDVAHHVKVTTLPPPGTRAQLVELTQQLHMELLDRSRPLWELWAVHGLADGTVALIQKTHHAMVDGVSGVDVAVALMDTSAEVRHLRHEPWHPEAGPGTTALVAATAADGVRRLGSLAGALGGAVRDPAGAARGLAGAARLARTLLTVDSVAPRVGLNRGITGRHRLLDAAALSMDDVRRVRAELGGTVNDVVLTSVAGAVGRLLTERGELVGPDDEIQVLVPVSLRSEDEHLSLGNRVSSMWTRLPVGEPDDLTRLHRVQAAVRDRKERRQAVAMAAVLGLADALPPVLAGALARTVHRQPFVNLVVTNVPGPPVPLYIMGARMLEAIPIVPLARNLDVSVGVLSYGDRLAFGLFADADTCPDVHILAEGIEKSFVQLAHVAGAHPTRARRPVRARRTS